MKLQIKPNINIDNTKVLGIVENLHNYRSLIKRIVIDKEYIKTEKQYITTYEIVMTKDDVKFYIGFDDRIKSNVETELNICWKYATFTKTKQLGIVGTTKELELAEHYFLSLDTDLRGEHPLSNILETQNILRDDETILIRLELEPISSTWYREVEHYIDNFNKKQVIPSKTFINPKDIALKISETALEVAYTGIDFINNFFTDTKVQHEYISNTRYSKLIRNGLSNDTLKKSKYNAYNTKIVITVDSPRHDMLFRNMVKAFNSMAGDNRFILVNQSKYKNILSSKEIAQIIQMPTRTYQELYKINNIDNREVEVPESLLKGNIEIGTVTHKGISKKTYWPNNKNILSLPKIVIGPMGAGKSEYTKNFAIKSAKKGDSVIVFDYIKNCELSEDISKYVDCIKINLSKYENLFSLAYPEIQPQQDPWQRLQVANTLSRQVEYLINSLSDEALSSRMSRYLDAASKVVFIHEGAKVYDVIEVLTNWKVRNEYIRKAKYSGIFKEDDIELIDLDSLHERDKEGVIIGTRDSKIEGIMDRINVLMKDIYLRTMCKAEVNYDYNFCKWMDEGKVILVQIPESTFTNKQVKDTIVTYFISRVWLATLQRNNHNRVCHIITDEIHQVPTAAKLVSDVITEARKFGTDFYFTIHYLRQFRTLQNAIQSAGASYMLLAGTEKENLKELEEELKPFTISEGLNLKPFHSLNIINYGNQYARFITKLPGPI